MISTRSRLGHTRIDRVVGDVPVREDADGSIHIEWPMDVATFDEHDTFSRSNCGWPLRALWCMDTSEPTVHVPGESTPTGVQLSRPRTVGGIPLKPWASGVWPAWRALPYQPIWPGFAINTVFYAAILWALFAAPFALRRRRRMRRGLCPACAYPVGASPVCTECGKPLRDKSVEPTSS
jgi:hypothetical protein